MNENVERVKTLAEQGKAAAVETLNKLSEKADTIPFFKGNMKRKLIALGGALVLFILILCAIFSGNDGDTSSLGNVQSVGSVSAGEKRGAEVLNMACKAYLEEKVGKEGLKKYEFQELKWSDNRAILKANVYIKTEPSIVNPADEGMDVKGTVVFFLEADGDDVNVVNMEIR